jgi:hypothetical protein
MLEKLKAIWEAIFSQSEYLAKALAILYVVTMVILAFVYHNYTKPKILIDSDLALATLTFESVKTADYLAEYFTENGDASARDAADFKATEDVKHFRKVATSREAQHTVDLLDIYLASAESLYKLDQRCSRMHNLMIPSNKELRDANGVLIQTPDDLASFYTVPFMVCLSERRAIETKIVVCRNEVAEIVDGGIVNVNERDQCQAVNERIDIERKIGLDQRYIR